MILISSYVSVCCTASFTAFRVPRKAAFAWVEERNNRSRPATSPVGAQEAFGSYELVCEGWGRYGAVRS